MDGNFLDPEEFKDEEAVNSIYAEHIERVEKIASGAKFLALELGEGWDRLCVLLDKLAPNKPYSRGNSAEDVENMAQSMEKIFTKFVCSYLKSFPEAALFEFYAFSCIMPTQSAKSIVEAAISVYGDKWLHAEKILWIPHIATSLVDTGPLGVTHEALYEDKYTRQKFKRRIGDPEFGPGYDSIHD
ncbi:hypothetical protein BJV82DRAFT_672468 [Fennellomyces sp. T-0311]|nr:hypothetical protein BJV82DRAFT_672468 [Fennellomyces sp. T-0311]